MKGAKRLKRRLAPEKINFARNTPIVDSVGRKWLIGEKIGEGAFGSVFDVVVEAGPKADCLPKNMEFVIKIEPSENGTLFTENLFFMRTGNPKEVEAWKKQRNLDSLGIPHVAGFGVREIDGFKYRYLIIEKLYSCNFSDKSVDDVFRIASNLVTTLEYMHLKGHLHHDIKEDNVMLSKNNDATYLIDFGMICSISNDAKPLKEHERNGTLMVMSRDAYIGQLTRRSDIEALFYNLLDWLKCPLPWVKSKQHSVVQKSKIDAFADIAVFIEERYNSKSFKGKLIEFGKYISTLDRNDVPNYDLIRSILIGTTKLSSKTQKVAKKTTAAKNNKTDEVQHSHKMVLRQRK